MFNSFTSILSPALKEKLGIGPKKRVEPKNEERGSPRYNDHHHSSALSSQQRCHHRHRPPHHHRHQQHYDLQSIKSVQEWLQLLCLFVCLIWNTWLLVLCKLCGLIGAIVFYSFILCLDILSFFAFWYICNFVCVLLILCFDLCDWSLQKYPVFCLCALHIVDFEKFIIFYIFVYFYTFFLCKSILY